ncbi:MAG: hypothetical protein ACTHMX_12745 [Thermomicrobiales bacterium]
MLPADNALSEPAGSRLAHTCLERLLHLLGADRTHPADGAALDHEFHRYCVGAPMPTHGFAWDAPLYEAPDSLKDTFHMHRPASDDRATAAERPADAFRWRRHPALLRATAEPSLPECERQARLAAVRGVLAARDGDLEAARACFRDAAREPSIRFQVVPGFWGCSRGGMDAAVAAYEDAGRVRDAAALAATIRTRYRPRAMQGIPETASPSTRRRERREPAAGTGD